MSSEKIEAALIFEVLGKPPEHLIESLEEIIKQIGSEKGISIKEKTVHEPIPVKENEEIFTSFAEIVAEFEDAGKLLMVLFKYMPAHIEVIYPEKITLKNNEINEVMNEIARRLHAYDEVARVIQYEKSVLETKLKDVLSKDKKKED
ncbi:MAG TPA: hypothetical protein VJH92_05180 [Candidatus Nanoarchaeia archaeon]|nr:hypothetical protein [Candidatus Nanoarchaeia archaeon]